MVLKAPECLCRLAAGSWRSAARPALHPSMQAWRQQRLAGRKPPAPPLCTVLWNDAYKIIFLK